MEIARRPVRPVKVGEFLRHNPPADTVQRLFAGSWISHNFAIWVGHPEDNRGWDALHAAREFLVTEEKSQRHDPAALARAWNEIYIAQGSDWFWWYGDDHSSALDSLFDHLFRKHLRNVYTLLGSNPPGSLFTPISRAGPHKPLHDPPVSFLKVKIDGRATYFEWIDAAQLSLRQRPWHDDAGHPRSAPLGLVWVRCRAAVDSRRHRRWAGASGSRRPIACASASSIPRNARSW